MEGKELRIGHVTYDKVHAILPWSSQIMVPVSLAMEGAYRGRKSWKREDQGRRWQGKLASFWRLSKSYSPIWSRDRLPSTLNQELEWVLSIFCLTPMLPRTSQGAGDPGSRPVEVRGWEGMHSPPCHPYPLLLNLI